MGRMSFTQELKKLATASEGMDAAHRQCDGQTRGNPTTDPVCHNITARVNLSVDD
jgi:hypothetical protein